MALNSLFFANTSSLALSAAIPLHQSLGFSEAVKSDADLGFSLSHDAMNITQSRAFDQLQRVIHGTDHLVFATNETAPESSNDPNKISVIKQLEEIYKYLTGIQRESDDGNLITTRMTRFVEATTPLFKHDRDYETNSGDWGVLMDLLPANIDSFARGELIYLACLSACREDGLSLEERQREAELQIQLTETIPGHEFLDMEWKFGLLHKVRIRPGMSRENFIALVKSHDMPFMEHFTIDSQNPSDPFPLDLSNADLTQVNLTGANLYSVQLSGADLTGANLRQAKLIGADLRQAKLNGADLRDANLCWADLYEADLTGANLIGASLRATNLRRTKLSKGQLSDEQMIQTRSE